MLQQESTAFVRVTIALIGDGRELSRLEAFARARSDCVELEMHFASDERRASGLFIRAFPVEFL